MLFRSPEFDKVATKFNQKILYTVPWPTQYIHCNVKTDTLDGLKGLKIRVPDRQAGDMINLLGMAAVQIPWGETVPARLTPSYRRVDGRAEILAIETLGANGQSTIVWKSGEMATVRATVRYHDAVPDAVLGLMIRTQIGFEVYGTNTELERVNIGARNVGDTIVVSFQFLCDLCPHAYTLTMASHDPDGTAHDWLDDAVAITVADDRYTAGVANLRAKVTVEMPQ